MRKLKNKLIVSDFDGTLITSEQEILPQVQTAINDYIKNGGIFAVCTGRMAASILPRVRKLGLNGIVIAQQGTVIAEIESGKLLKYGGMDYTEIAHICSELEELNRPINIYCGDDLYTNMKKSEKALQLYEKIIGIEAISVEGKLSEFVKAERLFCQKVSCLVAQNERDELYSELKKRLNDKFDVTCSASVLVEVSPKNDNKGAALEYLAEYYKIPLNQTVAVGDNMNDIPMILAAGTGIAVSNADEQLKSVADFVCSSNNEGAIAQVIEKYGYE